MNGVEAPNLKAFTEQPPRTRIGLLRLLWPMIHACLENGHSMRDIHKKLRMDGIEMSYSTLCSAVLTLRHNGQPTVARPLKQAEQPTAPGRPEERPGVDVDPLRNLRRLSEQRPGFDYSGTLPDEELFGSK